MTEVAKESAFDGMSQPRLFDALFEGRIEEDVAVILLVLYSHKCECWEN